MITTICLNPCFDKTVSVERLQPGQVNRIREARVDLGGKGINVAVSGWTCSALALWGKTAPLT